jgi:hypothetical protein
VAEALAGLLDFLTERGLADRVAYVEVHNEVDNCSLVPNDGTTGHYARLRGPLERAVKPLRARHSAVPVTYSLGEPWPGELDDLPEQAQIAHFHFHFYVYVYVYVYGVLGALYEAVGLGHGTEPAPETATWPTPELAACCAPTRPPSPRLPAGRTLASGRHGDTARTVLPARRWPGGSTPSPSSPGAAVSPAVLGAAGFQGVVLTSNAAPHHPTWHTDQDWMRRANSRVTAG